MTLLLICFKIKYLSNKDKYNTYFKRSTVKLTKEINESFKK